MTKNVGEAILLVGIIFVFAIFAFAFYFMLTASFNNNYALYQEGLKNGCITPIYNVGSGSIVIVDGVSYAETYFFSNGSAQLLCPVAK